MLVLVQVWVRYGRCGDNKVMCARNRQSVWCTDGVVLPEANHGTTTPP